jgi:citrate lyase subunit beta-like protein
VATAKAFEMQAIDLVHIDYKDLDGLREQAEEGARMGFTGKQVIHPGQVPVVQKAFSPSQEKIQWATELISEFREHEKQGKGAFNFRGHMIDMPLVKQAQRILDMRDV